MVHPTIPPRLSPAESLLRRFAQAGGLPFSDVLSAAGLQRVLDDCQVQFRDRIFSPLITVAAFLAQVLDPDHSMRQAVARLIAHRASLGLPPCSADTRAYSKARQRLPENVWADLTRRTGRDLLDNAPPHWSWRGRDVKIVDGTTLSMPDTPANQTFYPQPGSQKPGLGFHQVRMVALFSLAVGAVLDVALGPHKGKHTGETAL
ncbi:MAG TPA: IS4 family transposase, partial [Planctomycetales bacterium]|nr:IS4 family transposase [Planctomycetales bacterium]